MSVFNTGASIRSDSTAGPLEIHVALRGGPSRESRENRKGQVAVLATVVLVPSSPRRGNPFLYKEAQTDRSGQFSFRGVAPGEYKVFAWPRMPGGRPYFDEEFLRTYETRATSVRANAGATSSVQVTVVPLQ